MLPKKHHLNIRKQIDFFKKSRKREGVFFRVYFQNDLNQQMKIAVIIPKKTVSLAVQRNRIKRLIHQKIQKTLKQDSISGHSIVLLVKKNPVQFKTKTLHPKAINELEKITKL